jgi:hypothetical protein
MTIEEAKQWNINKAYEQFHKLWGIAKESPSYNKQEWQMLYLDLMSVINQKPFKL